MQFDLPDLAFLTSPRGEALLVTLAEADLSNSAILPLVTMLRRDYDARQTSTALELVRLRRAAISKFDADDAARMFFTRDALEQASHPAARSWHTTICYGAVNILDVCCGIGADSLAFCREGEIVTGVDIDPVRVEMARLNIERLGLTAGFTAADARSLPKPLLDEAALIFFDPARRDARGRIHHVEGYNPPLSTSRLWLETHRVAVKLSPGVQRDQLADYLHVGMSLDFVSADGELKEALLRSEDTTAFSTPSSTTAVMFIDGSHHIIATTPDAHAPLDEPRNWLVEPDPAIIRAGAVAQVALEANGAPLDSQIAYFTTYDPPQQPYLRAWRIREWMPFNVKKLRTWLRDHNIGEVTVKKRGTAVTPEVLIPQLKLKGLESCTLVLTQKKDQHIVLVCDNLPVPFDEPFSGS